MCGGGGSSGTQKVEQTTTNLPEYAEPYYRDLLTRTAAESSEPYQSYGGDRLAYFSPAEQEAMMRASQLGMSGTPDELNYAGANAAMLAGLPMDAEVSGSRGSSYEAGSGSGIGYGAGSRDMGYNARDYGESGYTASGDMPGNEYEAGQRNVGYDPGSLEYNDLQGYMDPYMQQVVDIQKREAQRQADIQRNRIGSSAAGVGSLGGYREAIEQAELARNTMQQTGDIQAQGSQAAWQQALASFEADRSANAQLEEFEQSQFGMNEGARQRQAELEQAGWSSAEAAKQAQEEFRQSAWGMSEAARQKQEEYGQSQFGMNEANKQFSAQLDARMYEAKQQAEARAAELGLRAEEITQAGQIAALNAKSQMEQNRLAATGMVGDFVDQRQAMEIERMNLMDQAGMKERGLMQKGLDQGYQDWIRQQAYPKEQLAFYSQMLQGTPVQPGTTTSTYGDSPSAAEQIIGTGISGYGLYKGAQG